MKWKLSGADYMHSAQLMMGSRAPLGAHTMPPMDNGHNIKQNNNILDFVCFICSVFLFLTFFIYISLFVIDFAVLDMVGKHLMFSSCLTSYLQIQLCAYECRYIRTCQKYVTLWRLTFLLKANTSSYVCVCVFICPFPPSLSLCVSLTHTDTT